MSQEEVKDQELELLSLFEQAEETFEQATARAAEEGKSFVKIPRFKMDKLGTYAIRVLPLCPDSNRKGYEFPIRQLLLKIDNPKDNKKPIYVNVCQAKQAGISVDLIDTYKTAAIDALKTKGDEDGAAKITENNFGGGLKWDYKHVMFIMDMSDKKKEIQMLDLSHSQFKDLDDRKLKLWEKLLKKEPQHPCPISSIAKAFPVEIEKKKDGAKTAYSFNIDNVSGYEELTNDDLKALLGAPRIDSILFRYTKYHLEATIEFLKQYDARMEINVMSTSEEVKEAIEKINQQMMKELSGMDINADPEEALQTFLYYMQVRENSYMSVESGVSVRPLLEKGKLPIPEGMGYAGVMLDCIEGMQSEEGKYLVLCIKNQGSLNFLDNDDIVEVTCKVSSRGIEPVKFGKIPLYCENLIRTVKSYEKCSIEAIVTNDREKVVWALAMNPLVNSWSVARKLEEEFYNARS